jgi:hypothetical protein
LQGAGRSGDTGSLQPEHHRQELLGEQELIRVHAMVRHQQPTATSLLDSMKVIASSGLRDLVEERVSIAKHDRSHGSASRQLLAEQRCLHPQANAGDLDVNAGGCPFVPQHEGQTHHTPSLPIVPTSAASPFVTVFTSEPTPVSMK